MTNQLIICKGDTSPKWLVIYRPPGHVCGQFSRSMIDTLFKVFPAANKSFPPSLASCLAKASGASELSANINANVNVNRTYTNTNTNTCMLSMNLLGQSQRCK